MSTTVLPSAGRCRHEKQGRCTYLYWKVMRASGKPGLAEYTCDIWKARMEEVRDYQEASERARRLGLTGEKERQAATRIMDRKVKPKVSCPHIRPCSDSENPGAIDCRYYFLEVCLLRLPVCEMPCSEYLPAGDQRA